jgi:hypothetical protein
MSAVLAYPDDAPGRRAAPDANSCAVLRLPRRMADPFEAAATTPGLWSQFLHRNYRSHHLVAEVYGVSESCARKWWKAEGGANADKLRVAVSHHPEDALRTFFGVEVA